MDHTYSLKHIYFFFFLLLLICYCNSFNAGWHFDDIGNILLNDPLHITVLNFDSVKQTFFAYPEYPGNLFRPVSNFTFGINWMLGQDNVFGYHLVNFAIHLITSIFLFKCCHQLLAAPNVTPVNQTNRIFIAALATILWSCNPVQTQAVTYIVQRAASLAALFYISGIYFYLKARTLTPATLRQLFLYAFCVICFSLALGSKENAIIFPLSIVLIEILFFQKSIKLTKKVIFSFTLGLSVLILLTMLIVGHDFLPKIFAAYETRDFSPYQRLLSESRIMIFYLSLLFYPSPHRLSITHDIQISTGLLSPPTTLISLFLLLALAVFSIIYYKKYTIFSFAILFFLLNHIPESTIVPLEFVFEHRNYLPSLFLFLPVAVAINTIIEKHINSNILRVFLTFVVATIIFLFCFGTIQRNNVWKTENSLWSDSLIKAPNSARSYTNLAYDYLYNRHDYQNAFKLYTLSLDKYSPTPWKLKFRVYNNLGYIMKEVGNYDKAIQFFNKALVISEPHEGNKLNAWTKIQLAKAYWLSGDDPNLQYTLINIFNDMGKNIEATTFQAERLVENGAYDQGLAKFQDILTSAMITDKYYVASLMNISLMYSRAGLPDKAFFFNNFAKRLSPSSLQQSFCEFEIYIRSGNTQSAEKTLQHILKNLTWPEFRYIIQEKRKNKYTVPLDYSLLDSYVSEWLTRNSLEK